MIFAGLAFYLFAGVAIASAIMVITARNPVHSVLFLILTFFNSTSISPGRGKASCSICRWAR